MLPALREFGAIFLFWAAPGDGNVLASKACSAAAASAIVFILFSCKANLPRPCVWPLSVCPVLENPFGQRSWLPRDGPLFPAMTASRRNWLRGWPRAVTAE